MMASTTTNPTLTLSLVNRTSFRNVNAYVTGLAINNAYRFVLIQSDGHTLYYPESPSSTGSPLTANCTIPLGPPGSSTLVTIPRIAGGRIWFCINDTLTFLLNPGPGLVEPSVSNPSDPNYGKNWGFCEFTFNDFQIFANISYVDFVSIPIALNLTNTSGGTQSVTGIPRDGLQRVCDGLVAQNSRDGKGWDRLIVRGKDGSILRALSPNTGIVMDGSLFQGYYDAYVNAVWERYKSDTLTVDTQAQWGTRTAKVDPSTNLLTFPSIGAFARPSARDIFSCSTGPFAAYPANTDVMGNLTARLAAALNRSTLLEDNAQPGREVGAYYAGGGGVTNHYSRVVHAVNGDKRGYAFPYDDVGASGTSDLAGAVWDGSPVVLEVVVGGY
ncbi:glucanase B [Leptodontidium sp. MPI-SDFR-AT-0119]|nr:glucanase B [Leptodontidium sp. MPI-SDFR-AT-0119]